jgi:hypothetical protein
MSELIHVFSRESPRSLCLRCLAILRQRPPFDPPGAPHLVETQLPERRLDAERAAGMDGAQSRLKDQSPALPDRTSEVWICLHILGCESRCFVTPLEPAFFAFGACEIKPIQNAVPAVEVRKQNLVVGNLDLEKNGIVCRRGRVAAPLVVISIPGPDRVQDRRWRGPSRASISSRIQR